MNQTLNQCREILNNMSDSDISSFCLDYFWDVYRNFGRGMLRTEKIDLLLEYCQENDQLNALHQRLKRRQQEQQARYGGYGYSTQRGPAGHAGYDGNTYRGYHQAEQPKPKPQANLPLIRKGLMKMFPHDDDFMAFCLDYFPVVHGRFGSGQQKTSKITMLLDYCQRAEQWKYLAKSLAAVSEMTPDVVIERLSLPG